MKARPPPAATRPLRGPASSLLSRGRRTENRVRACRRQLSEIDPMIKRIQQLSAASDGARAFPPPAAACRWPCR